MRSPSLKLQYHNTHACLSSLLHFSPSTDSNIIDHMFYIHILIVFSPTRTEAPRRQRFFYVHRYITQQLEQCLAYAKNLIFVELINQFISDSPYLNTFVYK